MQPNHILHCMAKELCASFNSYASYMLCCLFLPSFRIYISETFIYLIIRRSKACSRWALFLLLGSHALLTLLISCNVAFSLLLYRIAFTFLPQPWMICLAYIYTIYLLHSTLCDKVWSTTIEVLNFQYKFGHRLFKFIE